MRRRRSEQRDFSCVDHVLPSHMGRGLPSPGVLVARSASPFFISQPGRLHRVARVVQPTKMAPAPARASMKPRSEPALDPTSGSSVDGRARDRRIARAEPRHRFTERTQRVPHRRKSMNTSTPTISRATPTAMTIKPKTTLIATSITRRAYRRTRLRRSPAVSDCPSHIAILMRSALARDPCREHGGECRRCQVTNRACVGGACWSRSDRVLPANSTNSLARETNSRTSSY